MSSLKIPLGRYDSPEEQVQKDYYIDLYNSNLAVFGSSMSGKTVLLKTLILHMHEILELTEKEEIYVLDFGNGLKQYNELPYVVGYFNASNEESVRRVFKILKERLIENTKKLSGEIYSEVEEIKRPSHVTFILDGFSSFVSEERYFVYQDILKKLTRDGLSKGITVIIAGSDASGFNRISSSFNRVIAFDLPKDSYSELYSRKVEKPLVLKGRGLANDELNVYEFQAYLPWDFSDRELDEKKVIRNTMSLIQNKDKSKEKTYEALLSRKVKILPEEYLTYENWHEYSDFVFKNNHGHFVAGLDYYSLEPVPSVNPVILNLNDAQTIAIYGKKEFGKSNLLKLLIEASACIPNTHFCFWEDGRRALSKPLGLSQLITQLELGGYAKTVYNETEFVSYLELNGFLAEHIDERSEDYPYESSDDIDNSEQTYQADQESILDEEERVFRIERDRLIESGDIVKAEKFVEEHRTRIERIKKELMEKITVSKASNEHTKLEPRNYLTVFVIQSRLFYQTYLDRGRESLISKIDYIIGKNSSPVLFIFSDVQRIENRDFQIQFNNSVRYAFLLDDIVRFINNKGQNSVFGNQDISELKESFGHCELGDGFFYDIDRDCISKLKFIHSFPERAIEGE